MQEPVMDLPVPDTALELALFHLKQIPLTLENTKNLKELAGVLEKSLKETDKERFLKRVIRTLDYRYPPRRPSQGQSQNQSENKEVSPESNPESLEQVAL